MKLFVYFIFCLVCFSTQLYDQDSIKFTNLGSLLGKILNNFVEFFKCLE